MTSPLVDFFLAPLRRKTVPPTQRVGVGGAVTFGGFLQHQETKSELIGKERYKTFSNTLVNTSIVAAGTRLFLNLVSKAGWQAEPPEGGGSEAERNAELAQEILFEDTETPWHRIVRRASMYRFYGFSVQEWTAIEREDGAIGFLDIESRPQRTIHQWDLDRSGRVLGVVQEDPRTHERIYIPRMKIVHVVDDTLNDSPEGLGLFRHVVEPARQLARFEQLEGFGFETDLRGIPIGRAPFALLQEMVDSGKMSKEQKAAIEQPMRDFIHSHIKSPGLGLLLDSIPYESQDDKATPSQQAQWDLDLLKGGNTTQEAIANSIERKNREIARVLGVESLLLGETSAGSFALSKDKTQNFRLVVDSTLEELAETFEPDLLVPLATLNGWNLKDVPVLKTSSLPFRDVEQVAKALQAMAAAGAVLSPDDPAIDEVRTMLGLSEHEVLELMIDSGLSPMPGGGLPGAEPDKEEEPQPRG